MRIGGIASGMDTEQMVRDLMRAERVRVDKYYRQEEAIKWQQEALNTTNKTLAEFILKARSDFGLSATTSTGSVIGKSASSFDWVKKVTSSDESSIKVTASANAMEGTHKIKVEQLAEPARYTSSKLELTNSRFNADEGNSFIISVGGKEATINIENHKLTGLELNEADLDFSSNNLTFTVNKKEIVLSGDYSNNVDKLVEDIQTAIGQPEESGITVKNNEGKLEFNSVDPIVIESHDADPDNEGKLKLEKLGLKNGMSKGKNSINDVVKQINDSDLGLRAAYDSNLGKLMITAKESVDGQKIEITGDLANKFDADNDDNKAVSKPGQGAIVYFNDEKIENLKSNNLSIFGINLQFQAETEQITINVESNVDGIMDKVKAFVDDYNALIDDINGKLKEKSYRDFQPLTKEEKEAMKEKEIELWEEKAKSGLLRNDETLTRVLQTMRQGLYENVEGVGGLKHLTDLGITTGNYQSGGKLEINEEKLRKAIIDNPDGVVDMLFKKPGSEIEGDEAKRANTGLVERLFGDMITGMKEIVKRSGTGQDASLFRNVQSNMLIDFVTSGSISVMDRSIMDVGKRIANEERILIGREDRYWRQFTAMEKAMEKMNQQSGWLMSQLGQMG